MKLVKMILKKLLGNVKLTEALIACTVEVVLALVKTNLSSAEKRKEAQRRIRAKLKELGYGKEAVKDYVLNLAIESVVAFAVK